VTTPSRPLSDLQAPPTLPKLNQGRLSPGGPGSARKGPKMQFMSVLTKPLWKEKALCSSPTE